MQRQISNHLTATLARLDWEGLDGIPLALSSLDMVIMGIGDVIAVLQEALFIFDRNMQNDVRSGTLHTFTETKFTRTHKIIERLREGHAAAARMR